MQGHVELCPVCCLSGVRCGVGEMAASADSPGVQRSEEIERDLERRVEALHAVADRLYERWTAALSRGS